MKKNETKTKDDFDVVIDSMICPKATIIYRKGKNKLCISVKRTVPFEKRTEIVYRIAEAILPRSATTIEEYSPELEKPIFATTLIGEFTDFKIPSDLGKAWAIVQHTKIPTDIEKAIGKEYVDEIRRDVEKLVAVRLARLGSGAQLEMFMKKLNSMIDTFMGDFSSMNMEEAVNMLKMLADAQVRPTVDSIPGDKEQQDKKLS